MRWPTRQACFQQTVFLRSRSAWRSRRTPHWRSVTAIVATATLAAVSAVVVAPVGGLAGPVAGAQVLGDTDHPIYLDRAYSPEERAVDLVSRMTVEEKASQMNSSQSAAIGRLGIEAYGWWNESAHGPAGAGTVHNQNPPPYVNTMSYPVDLALGSTWNPELMYREAALISDEDREVVRNNTLDLNFYSPTVNLARDPRWGRNDEAFSEDPLLTAAVSEQFVNGMEGKDTRGRPLPGSGGYLKVSTTLKHYAANNSEVNRRDGSSDMDERTLREYYTAPFRDVIRQSQPNSLMTAYNEVNGVPVSASGYLLNTLARQTFGFEGFVTSDCDAIREIQNGHRWQPPGYPHPLDQYERHAFANAAGVDLDCQMGYHDEYNYANTIPTALGRHIVTPEGVYTENTVDAAVTRLFTTRIRLGEFDAEDSVPWVAAARARVAKGSWVNSDANKAVTQTPQRLAMARKIAGESLVLLKNADTTRRDGTRGSLLPLRVPASGPYRVAVVGWYANPSYMYMGGYTSWQASYGVANQVNGYKGIAAAVRAANPDAVVDYLPGVTPSTLAQVDAASVEAAANYDAVIVYAGTDFSTAREDVDRSTLALPGAQAQMISQIAARNPNTVVYLETIGQVDVTSFEPGVAALLWSAPNGLRKGEALADVLFGAVNPNGRLPFTWYRDEAQLPPITDYAIRPSGNNLGRTYMYFRGDVSYPFGFGLGYTAFQYSHLTVDHWRVDANGTVRVSVDVTNTGKEAGSEVAQLYVDTPDAPAALQRPIKRLRGFEKITLQPRQTRRVTFPVRVADLAFFDEQAGRFAVDPGRYGFAVGGSSADADLRARSTLQVTGTLRQVPVMVTASPRTVDDSAAGVDRRVLFPIGAVIDPQLTVAMNDDTRYGHLVAGSDVPLPAGTSISYRSNRPGVVAVGRGGILRAAGSGVATITVTVRYREVTVKKSFPVGVPMSSGSTPS